MANDVKLGQLLDSTARRDAIHIAIAPVVAAQILRPGDHVGLVPGSQDEVAHAGPMIPAIGIVDPYLQAHVQVGERFYMCLYMQSITALRHHWTHPAFSDVEGQPKLTTQEQSQRWLQQLAADMDLTFNQLMEAADRWVESEDYTVQYDRESWRNYWYDRFPNGSQEFWKHYEIATGKTVEDHKSAFFSCSC